MSRLLKSLLFLGFVLFLTSCSAPEEKVEKKKVIPEKISMLFVTQPFCPSCDKLELTMKLPRPNELIKNYFKVSKVYLGEELPDGLIPPNGTPTVYFLGSDHEVLVEPMIGEKDEAALMEFLEDALLEFKITYNVDLVQEVQNEKIKQEKENNETTI